MTVPHSREPAPVVWPAPVRDVVLRLEAAGITAYAVGGAVRDGLLGVATHDWDLATAASPDAVVRAIGPVREIDASLGNVRVDPGEGLDLVVTTFRREDDYRDRRHPGRVEFVQDLAVDAKRRDFTVNAIYLTRTGELIDPVGGLPDLRARLLRTVGPAHQRFEEDVLRMLRAVRLAASRGLDVEPATWEALRSRAPLAAELSPARVYDELTQAFVGTGRGRALHLLVQSGLAAVLLPEVAAMDGVPQPPEYHPEGDVLTHVALVLDAAPARDPVLAWTAVLHDIGKPGTFERAADRIRFSGHDTLSARMADDVLRRLQAPREVREAVVEISRDHIRFAGLMQMRAAKRERWMRSPRFAAHLAFHRADCVGSHGKLDVWAAADAALRALPPEPPPPLCTGEDVLALGVQPGPRVGALLRAVEAEIEQVEQQDRAMALAILRRLVESGQAG